MNGGSGGNNPHKLSDQFAINFPNVILHENIDVNAILCYQEDAAWF